MKKYFIFAAAFVALASCSNDNYVGDNSPTMGGESGNGEAIVFSSGTNGTTRANQIGADAANLLNKKFVVSGFKGDGATMSTVFDNYIVNWVENTAGKTASNTSDWEYVGITAQAPSSITGNQTIKYWDYSTSRYDFAAYSLGTNTAVTGETAPTTNQIHVSKITTTSSPYNGLTYALKGSAEDLAKCYISDMVTVEKENYQKEVQLTFRSLGTKIRVGLYETVPGYSVKDVKFYTDDATTTIFTGASATSATLFMPSGAVGFGSAGTYTVSFVSNVAQVAFTRDEGATVETQQAFGNLTYKAKERNEKGENIYLGRSSNNASYAGSGYTTVLPNTATGDVLELRVDYTLESIDGSGEEIKIHGAKAFVPATYTKWLPNYAYTYIFKISDNTNGWTSTTNTDPAGLYPITFDAVVTEATDAGEQSTITTVATPSITTYQKGHLYTDNEYSKAKGDIYVQVMINETLATGLNNTNSKLYQLSERATTPWSEAEVLEALNIPVTSTGDATCEGRNGMKLTEVTIANDITTIPAADGNNITVNSGEAAKITASSLTANKYYAYVYDNGYKGKAIKPASGADVSSYYTTEECTVAATGTADGATTYYMRSDYLTTAVVPASGTDFSGETYFTDMGCTVAATGTADGATTYYQKVTVNYKVYGVKVIKVVD